MTLRTTARRSSALRLLTATAVVAGLAVVAPAGAAPVSNDATWTEAWIPSGDGTMLHADVMLPKERKDGQKHPMILSIGPYFGSGSQGAPAYDPMGEGPSDRFNDLVEQGEIFQKGYGLIYVDSRGYGSSGGCNDLGGPGEQSDTKAAVEWAAKQTFSNGKVGMWGKSYDAWTQVMALSQKPKGLAATVIQSPLIDGYRLAFENGVHWSATWYVTPTLYTDYDLTPPTLNDSPEEFVQALSGTATNPQCYVSNTLETVNPDPTTAYWKARNIIKAAGESKVPSLWSFGFNDVNTKPTNIFPVYSALKGPKRAWFGQWDHVRGNEDQLVGREGFMAEAMNWFDHYLKGKPLNKKLPAVEMQDGDGAWRSEKAWPPKDAVMRKFPLLPGSYLDTPADPAGGLSPAANRASTPRGGTWTVSQPAPHDTRIAGLMKFDGRVGVQNPAGGNLVALVFDVAPDGSSRLITRGASAVTNANDGVVSFVTWPQDWLLPKGHRIAVQVSSDDATVYSPTHKPGTITLDQATLSIPILTGKRTSNLEGDNASAAARNPTPTLTTELEGRASKADFGPKPK
ncbi:MAG: CocE/NonD family hydrolase [Mycobacteriales bacterium]|nr:CocE/NonD family hydrolase [Mycobacteriales bacterium]